jgi:hypothetical protein
MSVSVVTDIGGRNVSQDRATDLAEILPALLRRLKSALTR